MVITDYLQNVGEDLNPIKHLWDQLGRAVQLPTQPRWPPPESVAVLSTDNGKFGT